MWTYKTTYQELLSKYYKRTKCKSINAQNIIYNESWFRVFPSSNTHCFSNTFYGYSHSSKNMRKQTLKCIWTTFKLLWNSVAQNPDIFSDEAQRSSQLLLWWPIKKLVLIWWSYKWFTLHVLRDPQQMGY